jgi:hypothetical protein
MNPGDAGREGLPVLAGRGQRLEGQPAPVPDLDGVGAAAGGQEAEHVALAEGSVHAELQRARAAQPPAQAVDELAQEGDGLLGIVHVARPVLEPPDVPGLGEMGDQGVVARVLPMMRIEPAEGPGDRRAGADDRAVDIDGESRQLQLGDGLRDQVLVERHQRAQMFLGEALEPVAHGAGRRHLRQATEPPDERVAGEIPQVLQAVGPGVQEREDQQAQARPAVIPAERRTRPTQSGGQREPLHVAPQQFEAAERRERLRNELDREITLDHSPQAVYAQAHQKGLLGRGMDVGASSLSMAQEALLIHTDHDFTPIYFRIGVKMYSSLVSCLA